MKIFVLNANKGGVGKFRVTDPHIEMATQGTDIVFGDEHGFLGELPYDLVFVHNSIATNQTLYARAMEVAKQGKLIVDIDDKWNVKSTSPLYKRFLGEKIPEKIVSLIKAASLVTTTTKWLAEDVLKYNKNIAILPNGIHPQEHQFQHQPQDHPRVVFGMATGSSHLEDVKLLRGFLNKMAGTNSQFALAGFDINKKVDNKLVPDFPNSVWKQYEEILLDKYSLVSKEHREHLLLGLPNKNFQKDDVYRRIWTKPIENYGTSYNWFDVALAPLTVNDFNIKKSELKIIEAGFHGIPIICSKLPMYSEVIVNGVNGFLVDENKSHKDFVKYARILMDDNTRTQMGAALRETVLERFNLVEITKLRKSVYESI